MTEFSGGPPEIGLESQADGSVSPVLVTPPELPHDSFRDLVLDCAMSGGDVHALFVEFHADEIRDGKLEAIRFYRDCLKAAGGEVLFAMDVWDWITGQSLIDGVTIGSLQKKWGKSKQAIQQFAKPIRAFLGIRSQTERTDEAKLKMREAHYSANQVPRSYLDPEVPHHPNRSHVRRRRKPQRVGRHRKKGNKGQ